MFLKFARSTQTEKKLRHKKLKKKLLLELDLFWWLYGRDMETKVDSYDE